MSLPLIVLLDIAVAGIDFVTVFILNRDIASALQGHVEWTLRFLRDTGAVVHPARTLLRHIARIESAAFHFVITRHRHIRAKPGGVDVSEVVGADLLLLQRLGGPAQGGIYQAIHLSAPYIAWNSASSSCVLVEITFVFAW